MRTKTVKPSFKRKGLRAKWRAAAQRWNLRTNESLFAWRLRRAFVGAVFLGLSLWAAPAVQAVQITGIGLSNTEITFEEGGLPNSVTVFYNIDVAGDIAIDIFQVTSSLDPGTRVDSRLDSPSSAGLKSFNWDGLWMIGGDHARRGGKYEFEITLTAGGSSFTGRSADNVHMNSVDIHDIGITPSRDADGQPVFPYSISYALAKSGNVSVKILNSTGTLTRLLVDNKLTGSEDVTTSTVTWNGLGDDGKPVPLGIYTVRLEATDPSVAGAYATPRERTITVTSLASAASSAQEEFENNVYVFPNPIRGGEGTFRCKVLRNGARLTLKIYSLNGDLVRSHDFGSVPAGTIQTFAWHADNQSGNKVGRGLYFYTFREESGEGTLQATKKAAVLK